MEAPVEQLGDVGVAQLGEDLPFPAEAINQAFRHQAGADDLDSGDVIEVATVASRMVDGPHPAGADAFGDHIARQSCWRRRLAFHRRYRAARAERHVPLSSNERAHA